MLACARKALIVACLLSWGVLVLASAFVFQEFGGIDPPLGELRAQVRWVIPGTLTLHAAAALVVVQSRATYAREWTFGLLASASGQAALWLVFAAILDKVLRLSGLT
jgi:hypothetical protein